MKEANSWNLGSLDSLIATYSEAQTGCPVTYSYTLDGARRLFCDFDILDIHKTHIFSWDIANYKNYCYEKDAAFKHVEEQFFRELESELGWHILIRAKKKISNKKGNFSC